MNFLKRFFRRADDPDYIHAREAFLIAKDLARRYPVMPAMESAVRNGLFVRAMYLAMRWPDETLRDIDILYPECAKSAT